MGKALQNVRKFGDFFNDYSVADQKANFVPGYQCEVIQSDKILTAMCPEDPLFCRGEEMALKHLGLTSDVLVGALEGVMLEIS